jgi:hypothetical protein
MSRPSEAFSPNTASSTHPLPRFYPDSESLDSDIVIVRQTTPRLVVVTELSYDERARESEFPSRAERPDVSRCPWARDGDGYR